MNINNLVNNLLNEHTYGQRSVGDHRDITSFERNDKHSVKPNAYKNFKFYTRDFSKNSPENMEAHRIRQRKYLVPMNRGLSSEHYMPKKTVYDSQAGKSYKHLNEPESASSIILDKIHNRPNNSSSNNSSSNNSSSNNSSESKSSNLPAVRKAAGPLDKRSEGHAFTMGGSSSSGTSKNAGQNIRAARQQEKQERQNKFAVAVRPSGGVSGGASGAGGKKRFRLNAKHMYGAVAGVGLTGAAYLAKKARDRMATKAEMPETAAPVASSIKDVIKQKISENPKAAMAAAGLGALGVGAGAYHRYKSRKNQG